MLYKTFFSPRKYARAFSVGIKELITLDDIHIPSCKKCKYYIPVDKIIVGENAQCRLFGNGLWKEWIDGNNKYIDSYIARMDQTLCGKYGFHYKRKINQENIPEDISLI